MAKTTLPEFQYDVPSLDHTKPRPYIDWPLVVNEIVTKRPFYVEYDFTFITSDAANTTLYKWTGGSWSAITGMSNPDVLFGRGFYAVDTAAAAYVAITEHYRAPLDYSS